MVWVVMTAFKGTFSINDAIGQLDRLALELEEEMQPIKPLEELVASRFRVVSPKQPWTDISLDRFERNMRILFSKDKNKKMSP